MPPRSVPRTRYRANLAGWRARRVPRLARIWHPLGVVMRVDVENLFYQLVDLPPEGRARYFAEHDVGEETRREVEELLNFDSAATSFLLDDIQSAASRVLAKLEGNRLHNYLSGDSFIGLEVRWSRLTRRLLSPFRRVSARSIKQQ